MITGYVLHLYPMSFEEFLMALEEERSLNILEDLTTDSKISEIVHAHLWERLKWYFVVGGLPEVVETFRQAREDLYHALQSVREKQQELILTYFADMVKHAGKVNSMHLERIWHAIPGQLAQTQEGSAKKFKFKGVIPQVNRYSQLVGAIDWLQAAGLIIKVPICNKGELPFMAYTKENTFKLYNFDVGILGALSDLPPSVILKYDYGSYKGYFAENFVVQEFLCSGVQHNYSWNERTSEVEFLREIDGQAIPIEVKSGWVTKAKSLKVFAERYHSPYRVIFSGKNLNIKNHVHEYPLYLAGKFPL